MTTIGCSGEPNGKVAPWLFQRCIIGLSAHRCGREIILFGPTAPCSSPRITGLSHGQPQGKKMLNFDSKRHCGSPWMSIKARIRVLEDMGVFVNDNTPSRSSSSNGLQHPTSRAPFSAESMSWKANDTPFERPRAEFSVQISIMTWSGLSGSQCVL